eukprot:m.175182 g.175182  ORF g.175182 m.175182 type:complete len:162 (+) comp24398_c0_seq1:1002-1487(+)
MTFDGKPDEERSPGRFQMHPDKTLNDIRKAYADRLQQVIVCEKFEMWWIKDNGGREPVSSTRKVGSLGDDPLTFRCYTIMMAEAEPPMMRKYNDSDPAFCAVCVEEMEKYEAELRDANLSEQVEQLKGELVAKTTVASSVEQRVEQLEKELAFQTKVAALT